MSFLNLNSKKSKILKIKDFRFLLMARFFATMALQVQAVVVGWQIYQLKHDPMLLGLIGLTEALPAIGSSFFSGHIVDNSQPAKIFQRSIIAFFLNSIIVFVSILPELHFSENVILSILFLGIFISGAARSFTSPSVFSLIPRIVGKENVASASAFNSSTYQLAQITGPAIGGLIYGILGATIAFFTPVILTLISLGMTRFFSADMVKHKNESKKEAFVQSVKSGFHFVFTHKILLSAMTLDMFSVLFGGAVAVLPMFADQVFNVGSTGLGVLRAAPAVGSVLMSVTLGLFPMRIISGQKLLWVVAGFGVCTLAFSLTTNFYFALFFLALSGVFDGISMVIRGTILQLFTPDHMKGRVSSLSSIFITSSNEIGAFESGVAASLLGLIPSVFFGGAMTLVVVGFVAYLSPELRKKRIEI